MGVQMVIPMDIIGPVKKKFNRTKSDYICTICSVWAGKRVSSQEMGQEEEDQFDKEML